MSQNHDLLRKDAHLSLRARLFNLQHGLCWWCEGLMLNDGAKEHPLYATVDHIIGLGKGGRNHPYNKLLAHRVCNQALGSVPAQKIEAPKGTTVRMYQRQQIERLQKIAEHRNESATAFVGKRSDPDGDSCDNVYRLPAPPL
jgi:hypothetical protein